MGHAHAPKFYAAVAIGVLAVGAVMLIRGSRRISTASQEPLSLPEGGIPCGRGLEPLADDGCFASPPSSPGRDPIPLVVYLHGRFPNTKLHEELATQERLVRLAVRRGFAVLALRGKQGQCNHPSFVEWWCWPSNERNAGDGPAFVERWSNAMAAAERRVGQGRRLLLGFSNGGYFASLIATRALYPFDAVVVAHAGPVEPTIAVGTKPPMLLVTADDDPSNDEVLRLSAELTQADWPHHVVAREGGHELPDWDIDMALTFFTRTRTEKLPLVPPLSTRPPRPRGDAGMSRDLPEASVPDEEAPAPTTE